MYDQVRKRQNQSSIDATQDSNQTYFNMVNVYVFDITSIFFAGKEYSENLRSIKNTGNNLTVKQMFDISKKLIVEQSEVIYGVNTINWEDSSWKQLSLIGDEEVINLSHAKVCVYSDSVLRLGKMNQNPTSNYA